MKLHLSFLLLLVVPALGMTDSDQFEIDQLDLDHFDSELSDSELDVDHMERELAIRRRASYKEKLGQCRGATCGVWGDPHIVTCDGLAWDCQGHGLFTIMKNHMYNIQGLFVDTGTAARRMFDARGSKWRPTITNDVAIDFLQSPDKYPVLQFSFGNINEYDGQIISEQDCSPNMHFEPLGMRKYRGSRPIRAGSVAHCRGLCKQTPGCTKFSFWANHDCRLNDDTATEEANPESWTRSITGTMDSQCGKKWPLPQLLNDDEEAVRGEIGNRCPLLFHVDGELQDLSDFYSNPGSKKKGYILGDENSEMSVYINKKTIQIKYNTTGGDIAEVHLKAGGHGPGELWSCYWNVYVCLPETEQAEFEAGGLGLLGTPNGNTADDWMTPNGTKVDIDLGGLRRETAKNYCVDNWCVSQADSIMMPTGNHTYENIKCEDEEYVDFSIHDPGCVLSADQIIQSCADTEPLLKYGCEEDCCIGGCDEMAANRGELTNVTTLSTEPCDSQYGVPDHRDCNGTQFESTAETVCPRGSGSVVKLLHSSGSMPLPEDAIVFYGIEMDTEPHDQITGKNVKFKVNNFLEDRAHVYVKHDKSVFDGFLDPVCETLDRKVAGCDDTPQVIEAGCYTYNHVTPFALVTLYVQSGEIVDDSATTVDSCCDEQSIMNSGVVEYTFEILCECPSTAAQ